MSVCARALVAFMISVIIALVAVTSTRDEAVTAQTTVDICDRTDLIRDEILEQIEGNVACADVTQEQLAEVLNLPMQANYGRSWDGSYKSGDTAGLTGLRTIDFTSNQISGLPSDFLPDSDALTSFSTTKAKLTMLPTGLFADKEDLLSVSLSQNLFATFPEGLKSLTQDNNPNLESLHIGPDSRHSGLFSEPVAGWIATLPTSL